MIGSKVALIGDVHIGVNKNSDDFFNCTIKWFSDLIVQLNHLKIKHVFVLGDWHHYRDEISVKALDISSQIINIYMSIFLRVTMIVILKIILMYIRYRCLKVGKTYQYMIK